MHSAGSRAERQWLRVAQHERKAPTTEGEVARQPLGGEPHVASGRFDVTLAEWHQGVLPHCAAIRVRGRHNSIDTNSSPQAVTRL